MRSSFSSTSVGLGGLGTNGLIHRIVYTSLCILFPAVKGSRQAPRCFRLLALRDAEGTLAVFLGRDLGFAGLISYQFAGKSLLALPELAGACAPGAPSMANGYQIHDDEITLRMMPKQPSPGGASVQKGTGVTVCPVRARDPPCRGSPGWYRTCAAGFIVVLKLGPSDAIHALAQNHLGRGAVQCPVVEMSGQFPQRSQKTMD